MHGQLKLKLAAIVNAFSLLGTEGRWLKDVLDVLHGMFMHDTFIVF